MTKSHEPARGLRRRAFTCIALLTMAALAFAASVSAAPTVTLTMTPVPIPGYPRTGDILGTGTALEARATISGSEYGGSPSPLTEMTFYSPAGFRVSPAGFASCAPSVLEASGSVGCPRGSNAATGVGLGVVSFGPERVNEKVSIQGFFAPSGGLTFYVDGKTPAAFEVLEPAHWIAATAAGGPALIVEVPLVETVPGADDASILSFTVKVGAAYKQGKRTVSYLTLPRSCPAGGVPIKAEFKFMSGETVTVIDQQPCPKRR
jgi:hypothetical protein